ncbi:MAG: AsmA-like C-terminal region-containing protein [Fibrobacterota bacterium]
MNRKGHRHFWMALLLGLLFLVLAGGFIPLRVDFVRKPLLAALPEGMFDSLDMGRATFSLWRGLGVDSLCVVKRLPSGTLSMRLPRLEIDVSYFSLLFHHLHIQRFILESPVIDFLNVPVPALAHRTLPGVGRVPDGRFLELPLGLRTVSLSEVAIDNGHLRVRDNQAPLFEARAVCFVLRLGAAGKVRGEWRMPEAVLLGRWKVLKLGSDITLDFPAITLDNLTGRFYNGTLTGAAKADALNGRLNRFRVFLDGIRLDRFYADAGLATGRLSGSADMGLTLSESALHPDSLRGRGTFHARDIEATGLPVQELVTVRSLLPALAHVRFDDVQGKLEISNGRIQNVPLTAYNQDFRFESTGWMHYRGRFSQAVHISLAPSFAPQLGKVMAYSLLPEEGGRYGLRLTLSGTFADPAITLDPAIVRRTVGNVLRDMGKGLDRFFR